MTMARVVLGVQFVLGRELAQDEPPEPAFEQSDHPPHGGKIYLSRRASGGVLPRLPWC